MTLSTRRDLKFYRNVCGHWFAPEDDRFRWRSRLFIARAGWCEVVLIGGPLAVVTLALAYLWPITAVAPGPE